MYSEVYRNPDLFNLYLRAQELTIPGKEVIVSEILSQVANASDSPVIGLTPCDVGQYYMLFRERCPRARFLLIDKSPEAISYITNTLGISNASTYVMPLENLSGVREQVDFTCCIFAVHLLVDPLRAFQELHRILVPGGQLFVVTMSLEQEMVHPLGRFFGPAPDGSRFLDLEILSGLILQAGFQLSLQGDINYYHKLRPEDVPIAFSRCANSFLYMQSKERLEAFHSFLIASSVEGVITLQFQWSMLMAYKI